MSQDISDFLQEQFKDFLGNNLGQIVQSGGQIAQTIVALVGETLAAVAGMVVAASALVISDIIAGMSDDYYGTEVFVLVLPTNITDFIDGLPGGKNAWGFQQLETELLHFRGHTWWPEATVFDGQSAGIGSSGGWAFSR